MAYEVFKILLVDDDPIIVKLYEKLLRENHYQVIVARDGEQALEKAFHEQPDVVILDIMMPKLDGFAVCARLRATPSTTDLPIIILTAMSGTAARQKAAAIGADDFVHKSDHINHIDGRIKMLLKRRLNDHTKSWLADLPGSITAEHTLRRYLKSGIPLAACYLDLKGFETFYEFAGFQEGERVLWKLARLLQQQANPGDLVAHSGMDHFTLLTTQKRAQPLAQTVIRAFDAAMSEWGGENALQDMLPTLSIAIILVKSGPGVHPVQVYDAARRLLQQAKQEHASTIHIAHIP